MSRGLFNISIHQSVDSDFRAFWLASVTRNILGYSLFWDGIQNGFSFRDRFEKWNFCGKWSSCSNKYQERGKIWLVAVYWSVEKNFNSYWICNSIIKNDSRNTVNCNVNKLTENLNYYPIFRRNVELYFFLLTHREWESFFCRFFQCCQQQLRSRWALFICSVLCLVNLLARTIFENICLPFFSIN